MAGCVPFASPERLPVEARIPPRQLAGWARVTLGPGERRRASVVVTRRSLAWWDARTSAWRAAVGDVAVEVGASSRDIRLRGIAG